MKHDRIYFLSAFCAIYSAAITLLGAGVCANAQSATTDLSFEVATVKPANVDAAHPFDPKHFWVHVYPARATYWSMTLKALFTYAYGIQQVQLTGPSWVDADCFDIEARFPKGATKEDEPKDEPKMLQALLKERFKLIFHIEKRELESYVLVVGKHGAKLKPTLLEPPQSDKDAPLKPAESNVEEGDAKSKITKHPDGSSTIERWEPRR
jgi:uncharacterized protein (TIGR03435 family)